MSLLDDPYYKAFLYADEGDAGPLADLLESGAELTPDLRNLLVKILRGELRRPNHRQSSTGTFLRHLGIVQRVHELERDGWKSTAAVRHVQEEFNCSDKTVRNALREEREVRKIEDQINSRFDAARRRAQSNDPGEAAKGREAFESLRHFVMRMAVDLRRSIGITNFPPRGK